MNSSNINERIKQLSAGEFADFNAFYDRLAPLLRSHLFRMCGANYCDDLVQESFIKAWKALETFRGESSLKNWIYRIATHVAIDHLRKNAHLKGQLSLGSDEPAALSNQADQKSYENLVIKAMHQLDSIHRAAFVLFVFEELNLKEISLILQIPEGTVKSRLSKSRAVLSAFLKKEGISYG